MKNINLLLLLTLLISVAGCKKDDDDKDNTPGGLAKVKTYTLATTNGTPVTYTYTYNSDGKLASELTDVNSGVYYSYSGNKITTTDLNGDTLFVYTTNSDGYIVIGVDPANTYTYEYNADWNMTNNNGNMATWGDGNRLTANNGVNVYTYYTDKTNTVGNENKGQKYFGVDSKNLVHTLTFSNFSTTTYTYEFDTQNRVTKRLSSNTTETYTYY